MFYQTERLKWCRNYETDVHTKRAFLTVCVSAYVSFVHMSENEGENSLVLLWISLCSATQLGIFSYSLIISRNTQFTMCDISTQCTTIDESQRVKQFQMITDYIITSEYIPQHLTNCQKQLAVNLFEFTTQPQSFASNCTLMSPVWIYPFKSTGWFLLSLALLDISLQPLFPCLSGLCAVGPWGCTWYKASVMD